jgi:hypothetical protein
MLFFFGRHLSFQRERTNIGNTGNTTARSTVRNTARSTSRSRAQNDRAKTPTITARTDSTDHSVPRRRERPVTTHEGSGRGGSGHLRRQPPPLAKSNSELFATSACMLCLGNVLKLVCYTHVRTCVVCVYCLTPLASYSSSPSISPSSSDKFNLPGVSDHAPLRSHLLDDTINTQPKHVS